MKQITTRQQFGNQYEPLPRYGWRCGFYSLTPELERHAKSPEFLDGLRRGRAQRQASSTPASVALILGLPHLVEMRRAAREAYQDAAWAQRRLESSYRAASMSMGKISCMGRDIGETRLSKADEQYGEVKELWDRHQQLSDEYEVERSRLIAKRIHQ